MLFSHSDVKTHSQLSYAPVKSNYLSFTSNFNLYFVAYQVS